MRGSGRCRLGWVLGLLPIMATACGAAAESPTAELAARLWKEGAPFEGTVAVVLELFDSQTGGRRIWAKSMRQRVFSQVLWVSFDRGKPGLRDLTLREGIWLQVNLDGERLHPRRRLWSLRYILGGQPISSGSWTAEVDVWAADLSYRFLPEAVEEAIASIPDEEKRRQARSALLAVPTSGGHTRATHLDSLADIGIPELLAVPLASPMAGRRWAATRRLVRMGGPRAAHLISRSLADPAFEFRPFGGEARVERYVYLEYLPGALTELAGLDVSGYALKRYEDRLKVAALLDEWVEAQKAESGGMSGGGSGDAMDESGLRGRATTDQLPPGSETPRAGLIATLGGALVVVAAAVWLVLRWKQRSP